jgi:hypothetical protein
MTIYSTLLAEKFQQLHPKLQYRYSLPLNESFHARGVMYQIQTGSKLLHPFYKLVAKANFLFPESGENIPFTISNRSILNKAEEAEIYWERTFYFPEAIRKFNAKMTANLEHHIVKDYLGDRSFFYSDLLFDVTAEGYLMISSGKQKFVLGNIEIPIPNALKGRVAVMEGFDEVKDVYTIHVSIYNDVIGRIMMYAGEFKESVN